MADVDPVTGGGVSGVDDEIYRQRWSTCNDCGCSITVTNPAGVPDPADDETEWERAYSCPVCGDSLADLYGNADPETSDDVWARKVRRLRAKVEALASALDRTEQNLRLAINGRPVRGMAENLAQNRAALAVDSEAVDRG